MRLVRGVNRPSSEVRARRRVFRGPMPDKVRLYALAGSPPSMSAQLMLEHKGVEYARLDLPPRIHRVLLRRVLRFPHKTVPAMRIDGRRVQLSRSVSRALDDVRPEPPLFPADLAARTAVEEIERWGDEELQDVVRRLLFWCLRRDKSKLGTLFEGSRSMLPIWAMKSGAPVVVPYSAWRLGADDKTVQADLAALPGMLDKIDEWIADGVIGGENLNAADFQLATSLRALLWYDDIRPLLEMRPAGQLVRRVAPSFPGQIGPVIPADWLAGLRAAA